jgi:hypothetical protein
MAVTIGKDVNVTGISNARSVTVNNSANEVECTKFGDTVRKYVKAMIEQTVEVECVDAPGVAVGGSFTLAGPQTGTVKYVVTNISRSEPLDGIITFTVSGSRDADQT